LLKKRFRVVPLSEIVQHIQAGTQLPPRTVAITFDDCYRDNLFAARMLADFGFPACFFVPTKFVDTDHVFPWDRHLPRLSNLSWDDVREMKRLGHEIGSHTENHADLGQLDERTARFELTHSRDTLERELGEPARWFAFPFGLPANCPAHHVPLIREVGYQACFSGFDGLVFPGQRYDIIPRVPVPCFPNMHNLELHLTGCLEWYYHIKRRAGLSPALT
jgi:peptidoglycan/xylan/chitin deacetylase (PgdA/CDA1 family)